MPNEIVVGVSITSGGTQESIAGKPNAIGNKNATIAIAIEATADGLTQDWLIQRWCVLRCCERVEGDRLNKVRGEWARGSASPAFRPGVRWPAGSIQPTVGRPQISSVGHVGS